MLGANLECINKSYYYLDAFVDCFTTILQNARSNYQEDVLEIWLLDIFRIYVEKIQVSLKYDKNNGTLNEYWVCL
jgi:hypothetical protein